MADIQTITFNGITFTKNEDGSWTDNDGTTYLPKDIDSEDGGYIVFTELSNFEDQPYKSFDNIVDAMQGLIELADGGGFSSKDVPVYDERLTIRNGWEGDTLFIEDITNSMRDEE